MKLRFSNVVNKKGYDTPEFNPNNGYEERNFCRNEFVLYNKSGNEFIVDITGTNLGTATIPDEFIGECLVYFRHIADREFVISGSVRGSSAINQVKSGFCGFRNSGVDTIQEIEYKKFYDINQATNENDGTVFMGCFFLDLSKLKESDFIFFMPNYHKNNSGTPNPNISFNELYMPVGTEFIDYGFNGEVTPPDNTELCNLFMGDLIKEYDDVVNGWKTETEHKFGAYNYANILVGEPEKNKNGVYHIVNGVTNQNRLYTALYVEPKPRKETDESVIWSGHQEIITIDQFDCKNATDDSYKSSRVLNTLRAGEKLDKEWEKEIEHFYKSKPPEPIDPIDPDEPNVYDLVNSYFLDKEQFNKFSSRNFNVGNGLNETIVNTYQYVIGCYKIPFMIGSSYIEKVDTINLQNFKTSDKANVLKNSTLNYDLGEFNIKSEYNNSLDYHSVNVELQLPFINEVLRLDIQDVINKKISVKMFIDLISSTMTYNIYSDGLLVGNSKVDIGVNIPLVRVNEANRLNMNVNHSDNGILEPTIVIRKPLIEKGKQMDYMTLKSGVLSDVVGYAQVMNCDLKVLAMKEEVNSIKNLLNSGVIIND